MEILYLLVPISLLILGLACWAFFWAVGSDQFGDMDSPARQILEEDDLYDATTERHEE